MYNINSGVLIMRTNKSIKNVISIVFFNVVIGILGFIKVKVFVNNLSNDLYSLNKDDKDEINNIFSTSKKFYNYIGIIMLIVAFIISFFVHYLTKANINVFYIQIVCLIFLFRNIIDYFFIAPRYIIEANQNNYKIDFLLKGAKILEIILEIFLISIGINYLIVLIPGIIITIIIDLIINRIVYKGYPYLKNNHTFNKKYLKGTKDLVYLKLSGIMNSNTDIILLSTFINPLSVIIYTSYNYITKFVSDTVYIAANAVTPSYANVLNKEKNEKKYSVFCELNILSLFMASFCFIMLYEFLSPLVYLWLGGKYLVNNFTLLLFCFIIFQSISVRAVIITINSLGLFKETKIATICEAIINFIISISLVHKYGIIGVLLGTIIATLLTTFIKNAVCIYKKVFNKKCLNYFLHYFVAILINAIVLIALSFIKYNIESALTWVLFVAGYSIIVMLVLFIIYYLLFDSFRLLTKRMIEFIKIKGKYTE